MTTTLRQWRFPILIGSGLLAAGILFYFANTHLSTDKTQGAIGKRDVYREGQVNSADVAQPGTAPVATQAILESSEFKELAKNPAFVSALKDGSLAMALKSPAFTSALQQASVHELNRAELTAALKADSHTAGLVNNTALNSLFSSKLFLGMASNIAFRNSLLSGAMQNALVNGSGWAGYDIKKY